MKRRQFTTMAATVVAAILVIGCARITEPTAPASRSPSLDAQVHEGAPVAARLLGNNRLNVYGFGWENFYCVSLLTRPTAGGAESYVNVCTESGWVLHHTSTMAQLADINVILDAFGLTGSQTLLSFIVSDGFANVQERVLDTPLVLR